MKKIFSLTLIFVLMLSGLQAQETFSVDGEPMSQYSIKYELKQGDSIAETKILPIPAIEGIYPQILPYKEVTLYKWRDFGYKDTILVMNSILEAANNIVEGPGLPLGEIDFTKYTLLYIHARGHSNYVKNTSVISLKQLSDKLVLSVEMIGAPDTSGQPWAGKICILVNKLTDNNIELEKIFTERGTVHVGGGCGDYISIWQQIMLVINGEIINAAGITTMADNIPEEYRVQFLKVKISYSVTDKIRICEAGNEWHGVIKIIKIEQL